MATLITVIAYSTAAFEMVLPWKYNLLPRGLLPRNQSFESSMIMVILSIGCHGRTILRQAAFCLEIASNNIMMAL